MKSAVLLIAIIICLSITLYFSVGARPMSNDPAATQPATRPTVPPGAEVVTFGAGCFWCTEAVYRQIPGVLSATSGYMGGTKVNPTYEDVCTGRTGHAEVVQVVFDPKQVTFEKVLEVFWHAHNPTTLNRQGHDSGTQYRSAIYYTSDAQRDAAIKSKEEYGKALQDPIVTEITKASAFYPAELYHQDYYTLNKDNPYCQAVIAPKLKKLGLKD
jgi:peptide-methionine (S)-S-oxide reductase